MHFTARGFYCVGSLLKLTGKNIRFRTLCGKTGQSSYNSCPNLRELRIQ